METFTDNFLACIPMKVSISFSKTTEISLKIYQKFYGDGFSSIFIEMIDFYVPFLLSKFSREFSDRFLVAI